jgi:translocator protein
MNTTYNWYSTLIKPAWAPPSWLFGPVWSVLYLIIFITFGLVFYKAFKGELSYLIALPFLLNLVFNFAFTPLQFGLQSNLLAALDILLVLTTLLWALIVIYPVLPWVAYVNLPYLAWVSFATILQLTITYLNWGN